MSSPFTMMTSNSDFGQRLKRFQGQVEAALERCLPANEATPARLHQAMRYSVLGGGKRIRPVLVYAAGEALGAPLERLDGPACAVELIHAYSLIHDDLPAMDDDDLRRGRPTCHKAFDEATAILAGDALQALAFEILARDPGMTDDPARRLAMITALAQASGSLGMVGGQAVDLEAVGRRLDRRALEAMHGWKTGALIRAAVALGAESAGADAAGKASLDAYAQAVGLAFQVRDDILDVEGDAAVTGKTQGADMARDKPTYVSLLGLEGAKRVAGELHQQAMDSLSSMDSGADMLRWISAYIVDRNA